VARALTRFVTDRAWLGAERCDRMSREAGERVALEACDGFGAAAVTRLVTHLRATRQLTAGLILRAVLSGRTDFALAALAALLPPEGGLALQALGVLLILLSVAALVPTLLGKLLSGTPRGTLMGLATGRILRSLGRTGATAGAWRIASIYVANRMRILAYLGLTLVAVAIIVAVGGAYLFYHYGRGLPDHKQLAAYEPATVTRVHAGDGRLLAEYAVEKRIFVPLSAIPQALINAFLSAEDKNFYSHVGVDPISVAGALVTNISNFNSGKRMVGASTITQQVAKNFLLTNEVSITRKVKEAILALRIENAFSKDEILELYLNEIYLGIGSYGVAAAALNYFNKSLDELSLSEMAYLAALPKAPNNYHPVRKYDAAVTRRDWVMLQMLQNGFITDAQSDKAKLEPLAMKKRDPTQFVEAEYFAEEVRRKLYDRYGEKGLYKGGLSVHTTVDPVLQAHADDALRKGLAAYDQRHGWRGPLARITPDEDWRTWLAEFAYRPAAPTWQVAVVRAVVDEAASVGFTDGTSGTLPLDAVTWARPQLEGRKLGPKVKSVGDEIGRAHV